MKHRFLFQSSLFIILTAGLAWGYLSYFDLKQDPSPAENLAISTSLEDLTNKFAVRFTSKEDVKNALQQAEVLIENVDSRVEQIKYEQLMLQQKKEFLSRFVKTFSGFSQNSKKITGGDESSQLLSKKVMAQIERLEEKYGASPVSIVKLNEQSTLATFYGDILVQRVNGKFVIVYDLAQVFLDVLAEHGGHSKIKSLKILNPDQSPKKYTRLRAFIDSYSENLDLDILEESIPGDNELKVEIEFLDRRKRKAPVPFAEGEYDDEFAANDPLLTVPDQME